MFYPTEIIASLGGDLMKSDNDNLRILLDLIFGDGIGNGILGQ